MNPTVLKYTSQFTSRSSFSDVFKETLASICHFYDRKMGVYLSKEPSIELKSFSQQVLDRIQRQYPNVDFDKLLSEPEFRPKEVNVPEGLSEVELSNFIKDANSAPPIRTYDRKEITETIFHSHSDVFGTYFSADNRIEIYLGNIRLFCLLQYVDEKEFFKIVLAHELAHLYNHRGLDKDDCDWDEFDSVHSFIVEGLAQYYTRAWIDSAKHNTQIENAFEITCSFHKQYRVHRDWILSLEKMYSLFITVRRTKITGYEQFKALLEEVKSRTAGWPNRKVPIIYKLPRFRWKV